MSQNNPSTIYAGLDVAKDSLALDFQGRAHALSNDAKGHARLLALLGKAENVHVVIEATGAGALSAAEGAASRAPSPRCTRRGSP